MRLLLSAARAGRLVLHKPRENMNQTQPRERVWDLLVRVVQELFDDMRDALEGFRAALMDDALDAGCTKLPRATRDARRIERALDRAETFALEVLRLRATIDTMHLGLGLSAPRTSLDDSLGEVIAKVELYSEDVRYFAAAALQRGEIDTAAGAHLAHLRDMLGLLDALLALDSYDADHMPRLSAGAIVEYADGCDCEHCLPARQAADVERGQRAMLRGGSDAAN
jgi:hypothetical protein